MDKVKDFFEKYRRSSYFTGSILFLAVLIISIIVQGPANFFSVRAINTLFTTNLPFLLVVIAQSILLITGVMDVSCGVQVALVNVVVIMTAQEWGISFPMAFLLGIAVAVIASILCWLFVSAFRLPPLLSSYALTYIIKGVNVLIMDVPQGKVEKFWYKGYDTPLFGIIPIPLIILVVVLLVWRYFSKTKFGTDIYAVGTNPRNAFAAGIKPEKTQLKAFIIKGVIVGIAGVCLTLMTASGNPNQAEEYGIRSLSACIIGGLTFGGWGSVASGVFGGGFLIMIQNAVYYFFNLLYKLIPGFAVSSYWHNFLSDIIVFLGLLMTIVTMNSQKKALEESIKQQERSAPEQALTEGGN